jgi:hypothetical protein
MVPVLLLPSDAPWVPGSAVVDESEVPLWPSVSASPLVLVLVPEMLLVLELLLVDVSRCPSASPELDGQ